MGTPGWSHTSAVATFLRGPADTRRSGRSSSRRASAMIAAEACDAADPAVKRLPDPPGQGTDAVDQLHHLGGPVVGDDHAGLFSQPQPSWLAGFWGVVHAPGVLPNP